jgi:hypothetical protein
MREELEDPDFSGSEENLADPGLQQLRNQTKNTMIPLLIRIFQLRLEAQQLAAPPSRLSSSSAKGSVQDIVSQLVRLDKDLQLQQVWLQSCLAQVQKVREEVEKQSLGTCLKKPIRTNSPMHPRIQKSFQIALLPMRSWWQKFLRRS